jgi:hypothetical protein
VGIRLAVPQAPERIDYGLILALIQRLVPDPSDRRKVLWDTPARLFGFDSASATPAKLPAQAKVPAQAREPSTR